MRGSYGYNSSPVTVGNVAAVLLAIAVLIGLLSALGAPYSSGTRTGAIVKLSQKGFVNKSWEGEMVLGGVRSGAKGTLVANTFDFTVTDNRVAERLLKSLDDGAAVKVQYAQTIGYNPFTRDTSYTVLTVEEVAP